MPTEALTVPAPAVDAATMERVVIHGDLSKLSSGQKVGLYKTLCDRLGLDPLSQPFAYLVLNGKEILYAKREATEQLRKLHKVSIQIPNREMVDDIYIVTARAILPDGRCDENIGAVPVAGLKGDSRANAMMKAETKAKRRVTLSICGLGMLDESEIDSIPPTALVPPGAENLRRPPDLPEPDPVVDAAIGDVAPIPGPADDGAVSPEAFPGSVLILDVTKKPTRNPTISRYTMQLSDGSRCATINEWVATLAEQCWKQKIPIRVKTKSTKYGDELVQIMRADEPDLPFAGKKPTGTPPDEPPPLTDDEIPF